jgi:hypothetical protein
MISEEEILKQRDYSTDEIQKQGEHILGGGGQSGRGKICKTDGQLLRRQEYS